MIRNKQPTKNFSGLCRRAAVIFAMLAGVVGAEPAGPPAGGGELSLNGDDWTIASFEPGKGVKARAFADGYPALRAIPATVPGDVHWDLERSGKLEPIFYGTNSQSIGWVAGKEWWYRKQFKLPDEWQGKDAWLRFDGADYLADVWLNGTYLGRHEGQFTTFEFEVTPFLRPGATNDLAVLIHAAPAAVRDAIASGAGEWPVMRALRKAYPRWKSQTNAGWDWGAKIITMGLWQDVRLRANGGVRLSNLLVRTHLSAPYDQAHLDVEVGAQAARVGRAKVTCAVRCLTGPDSPVVVTRTVDLAAAASHLNLHMTVPDPRLWWPNGYGPQNLYEATVRAFSEDGIELDELKTSFGIRDLQMLQNPETAENRAYVDYTTDAAVTHKLPQPPPERRYLIQINGRRIFARGGNWIPCDLLYGRPRAAEYGRLIRLAARANYNLFRVWGGGLIEKQTFYDLCDRYGIMLFQEFPNAGERWPETDEALAMAADETRQILPRLMNHPSIVRYGGGNEWYRDAETSRQMAQLRRICGEMDPSRPFHDPDPECIAQRHGPHSYDWAQHYQTFNTGYPLTAGPDDPLEWTEYGAAGAASVETLRYIFPSDHLWPIRASDPFWIWHKAFQAYGADNWMGSAQYHHLFGDLPDLETTVRCSQFVQAEALRYADQAMRRFQWHRSACASWTYDEPWPNAAHGCIVGYYGRPKMAYYFTRRAYAPVDVSAEYESFLCRAGRPFPVRIHVANNGGESIDGGRLTARAVDLQGREYVRTNWTVSVASDTTLHLGSWEPNFPPEAEGTVILVQLQLRGAAGTELSTETYAFGVAGPQPATVSNPLKVPALSADGRLNLALWNGAQASASSVIPGYAIHQIDHLNDGWYGNSASWIEGENPAWAEIDLGRPSKISRVCVGNDHAGKHIDRGATDFRILTATEYAEASSAPTWRMVAHYKGEPLTGTRTFDFTPTTARWVRVDILAGPGARLDEIEVYEASRFGGDPALAESKAARGPVPDTMGGAVLRGALAPLLAAPRTALELTIERGNDAELRSRNETHPLLPRMEVRSGEQRRFHEVNANAPVLVPLATRSSRGEEEELLGSERQREDGRVYEATIRNRGAVPALFVALEIDPVDGLEVYVDDSYFTLMSGAAKTIHVFVAGSRANSDTPARLRLRARAWNSTEVSRLLTQPISQVAERVVPYGVSTNAWPEFLGNQRARVRVDEHAEAVWAHVPWRRRDQEPEKKNVVVVDLTTGATLKNVARVEMHRAFGDLVFQPDTVPGDYGIYYLPYKQTGSSYFPSTVYDRPVETADVAWRERLGLDPAGVASGSWQRLPRARVIQFEARSEFDRVDPMEMIATPDEARFLARRKPAQYLLFPENRRFPIRMTEDLPLRWITNADTERFEDDARPGEFYTFQVGLYAAQAAVRDVRVGFSDLVAGDEQAISAEAFRCFNLGGTNWLGQRFTKGLDVSEGKIQPLWFGVQVPLDAARGVYTGRLHFSAESLPATEVGVRLAVGGEPLPDAGDSELWRQSRLRWLDSTIGLDEDVVGPYTPVKVHDETIHVLGRNVTLAATGLPAALSSTFTESVDGVGGAAREILARPIQFVVETARGLVQWRGGRSEFTAQHPGSVRWRSESAGDGLEMRCEAKMDCDGYMNYTVTIRAARPIEMTDARLEIPMKADVAKYMMGLGRKGGRRPAAWQWKWDINRANNVVWVGDVNAGLHCKLKGARDVWELYNLKSSGLPESWSNGGAGGCSLEEESPAVVVLRASAGARRLEAGQALSFRFGLMVTPLKTLNPAHWNWRYWHAYSPVEEVAGNGANVINLHHATELNPFINYPFLKVKQLKEYVDEAHRKGIKVKLYYTIRELSDHTVELWALRSLGDEIYRQGPGFRLADQFAARSANGDDRATGAAWLCEHLVTDYVPAWHQKFGPGEWDAAIATTGLSRWHNYYLEGMAWLIKSVGVDGIYLDGIGYDREIMKRLRKVMDRARPGCLIDFHCGNHYAPEYGMNNIADQHMEHLPYIDSLWLGEGFNYDETPDYWLVELSGIPFGLFGEMLGVGNPWRGMIYGQSNRLPYGGGDPRELWKIWDAFGIQDARMMGYWTSDCPVRTGRTDVLATAYVKAGKTLIALASWAKEKAGVKLALDWRALGLDSARASLHAPKIPGFQEEHIFQANQAIEVPPGRGWLIVVAEDGGQGVDASQ